MHALVIIFLLMLSRYNEPLSIHGTFSVRYKLHAPPRH